MIYVHIPFCRSFCTYCDFYSEVASDCHGRYASALCEEIKSRASEITSDTSTLYIGGGTPSVLPLSVLESLVKTLESVGHGGPYREFTVEVNPDDIVRKGPEYVEGLLRLGVNRISMGVQSFDDGILKWMNRRHDSAAARKAYSILEDAGVPDISIDLIFGMPHLTDDMWRDTLEKALSISSQGNLPHHISSYQLSVEPGSALAAMVERGQWTEASEEQCERQYAILCEVLGKAGYGHYEISNFALPGHEAVHNSAYWAHEPYVGFGPAAHSFRLHPVTQPPSAPAVPDPVQPMDLPSTTAVPLAGHLTAIPSSPAVPDTSLRGGLQSDVAISTPVRQWNTSDLHAYMAAAESGDFSPVVNSEQLTPDQLVLERVMLGLRTAAGLPESFLRAHCSADALSSALAAGNLVRQPAIPSGVPYPAAPAAPAPAAPAPTHAASARLRIPESRFFISDAIISDLI